MSNLAAGSPRLLLAVSFGTSFADTREKTIGAIEKCIEKRHPDCTVRRCFTSRFIRKKLQESDGLYIAGPEDAIRDAKEKGIRELYVQPLYLMHGTEHRRLMEILKEAEPFFDRISVGKPLLFDDSDFNIIADAIFHHLPVQTEDTAVVLMGHGNEKRKKTSGRNQKITDPKFPDSEKIPDPEFPDSEKIPDTEVPDTEKVSDPKFPDPTAAFSDSPASKKAEESTAKQKRYIEDNAVFGILQDTLRKNGADNYFIATVEGEPELEDILPQICSRGFKKVILAPFMVVSGDHARNDLAGDREDSWKSIFLKKGFEVETVLCGIGEWEEVQELFAAHAGLCLN